MRGAFNRTNLNKVEATSDDDIEIPVPKASYGFDSAQYDDNFNPFSSGGSKLQNSPPPCPHPTFSRENPAAAAQYSATSWTDTLAAQEDPVTTQEYSTNTRENSTAAQEDPTVVKEDPVTTWVDPTTTQVYSTVTREYAATAQESPNVIRGVPTSNQEDPVTTLEDPTTTWERPTSAPKDPTAKQKDPAIASEYQTTAREVLTATQEDPPAVREDPPATREDLTPAREDTAATREDPASQEAKPLKMEFGLTDEGTGGEPKKPPPKKLGKKPASKLLAPRKQRPKLTELAQAAAATQSSDDAPLPKTSYSGNPSEWDDPNFNPFGTKAKMSSSPTLPKGSYSFDPDRFDDSVDPFKPSKSLAEGSTSKVAPPAEKPADEPAKHKLELPPEDEERKDRQSPKKNKSRIIT